MKAAEELEAVRAQLAALRIRETELVGLARKETDEAAERARVAEWETERMFHTYPGGQPFQAVRTWPINCAGIKRWWVAAGVNGSMLAVWEVNEYRGERRTQRIHGSAPMPVWLALSMAWELAEM